MPAIRIASVPASQVYIRHIEPLPGRDGAVVRLPDPRPLRGDGTEQSGWWPPAMLEAGWIDENADAFDVMHVHFGFDALTPDELHRVAADLRRHGKPLVYTVHDLTNPHHSDPSAHDAALDVLIPAADALITLTPGAAQQIHRRWGREALTLPHPHVVDLDLLGHLPPRSTEGPLRFGLHLKSLRPNMAGAEAVDALVAALDLLDEDAVLQVNTHPEVMSGSRGAHGLAQRLEQLAGEGTIDLQVHPYFDEDQLWSYLCGLDASVLAYRWGTHSGWLEACLDLGTAVIAPDCGFYAQQRPVFSYHGNREDIDATSLAAAVQGVAAQARVTGRRHPRLDGPYRRAERGWIADEHEKLYRALLG